MEETSLVLKWFVENWEIIFINTSLIGNVILTTLEVHASEIKNLKENYKTC